MTALLEIKGLSKSFSVKGKTFEALHDVNLSVGDSRWLFDWADVGDWVYVWDPSGKTPVDPGVYTAGGA